MLIYHYDNVIFAYLAALERNGSSKQQRYTNHSGRPFGEGQEYLLIPSGGHRAMFLLTKRYQRRRAEEWHVSTQTTGRGD